MPCGALRSRELAESLPEADAVLGFDDYADVADRLRTILAGERHHGSSRHVIGAPCCHWHLPRGPRLQRRSRFLGMGARPVPVRARPVARAVYRRRLDRRAVGAAEDRFRVVTGAARSARFRHSVARTSHAPAAEIVAEAAWLVEQGVREVFLRQRKLLQLRQGSWRHPVARAAARPTWPTIDGLSLGPACLICSRPRCGRA